MSGYDPTLTTPPGTPPRSGSTPVLSIVSFVLSAIAVLFVPILFGTGAIVTAAITLSKRQRYAKVALGVAIAATVLGFVLGFVLALDAIQGAS